MHRKNEKSPQVFTLTHTTHTYIHTYIPYTIRIYLTYRIWYASTLA